MARALRETARAEDVVARWGGEEFLVVPAPPPETGGARQMAERLRAAVARAVVNVDGRPVSVTASLGVATGAVPAGDDDDAVVGRLLRAADTALYAAKAAGRDRVVGVEAVG